MLAAAAVLAAGGSAAGLLLTNGGSASSTPRLAPGVPVRLSAAGLRRFAQGRKVYWLGPLEGRTLEVTRTARGDVYVRYLTRGAATGDGRPLFTTIGSFPLRNAFAVATQDARRSGMASANGPGHSLAVWRRQRPTSVYLAFPGRNVLIEVYDPSPRQAKRLALSGRVRPVR